MKRIYKPSQPSAFAKEVRRRAKVSIPLAQLKADLFVGAVYGD